MVGLWKWVGELLDFSHHFIEFESFYNHFLETTSNELFGNKLNILSS